MKYDTWAGACAQSAAVPVARRLYLFLMNINKSRARRRDYIKTHNGSANTRAEFIAARAQIHSVCCIICVCESALVGGWVGGVCLQHGWKQTDRQAAGSEGMRFARLCSAISDFGAAAAAANS